MLSHYFRLEVGPTKVTKRPEKCIGSELQPQNTSPKLIRCSITESIGLIRLPTNPCILQTQKIDWNIPSLPLGFCCCFFSLSLFCLVWRIYMGKSDTILVGSIKLGQGDYIWNPSEELLALWLWHPRTFFWRFSQLLWATHYPIDSLKSFLKMKEYNKY